MPMSSPSQPIYPRKGNGSPKPPAKAESLVTWRYYDMKPGHQQTGRTITVAQGCYRGHLCGQC
jgi:hypothetical protein